MERVKTTQRKIFSKDDKIFIFNKSHERCSHCGKKLTIGDNFTIEHAIPISKGGTNQPWNIVALCKECNDSKADSVVNVIEYYKYLNKDALEELHKHQLEYFSNIEWLDLNTLIKEDIKVIEVLSQSVDTMQMKMKGKRKKIVFEPQLFQFKLSKAVYKDLDEIYNLTIDYNSRFMIENSEHDVKDLISNIFSKGVIYILRDSSDKLLSAIPLAFTNMQNIFGDKQCVLKMYTPVYSEVLQEAVQAVHLSIEYIIESIKNKFTANNIIPMIVSFASNDILLNAINQYRVDTCYFMPYAHDKGITNEYAIYETDRYDGYDYDFNEVFEDFSNAVLDKIDADITELHTTF